MGHRRGSRFESRSHFFVSRRIDTRRDSVAFAAFSVPMRVPIVPRLYLHGVVLGEYRLLCDTMLVLAGTRPTRVLDPLEPSSL